MIRTNPEPLTGPTRYPQSDNFSDWGYILQYYNAQSPESVYLRDEVLPMLVPALESLMAHLVEENGRVAADEFRKQIEAESPSPTSDPGETLARELEYEYKLRWNPSRILPETLHNHSTKPIKWLALELRRLSIANKMKKGGAAGRQSKEGRRASTGMQGRADEKVGDGKCPNTAPQKPLNLPGSRKGSA